MRGIKVQVTVTKTIPIEVQQKFWNMENLRMFDPITGKALITDSEYNIGAILIDSEGHPFLHDGRKVGDLYGCLIGYSNGVLCRADGIDRFLKKATILAPMH